jgi:phosphomannomutase
MIVSASGVRGVLNRDFSAGTFVAFARGFARFAGSDEVLVARDTRNTGDLLRRAVVSGLVSRGVKVLDFGIISTPALFRESRMRKRPAIMITASHNEPEFNGLKFLVDGVGIAAGAFSTMVEPGLRERQPFLEGSVKSEQKSSYGDDLVLRFGKDSCQGVRVALDLGGGAALVHAAGILRRLGCRVISINDAAGVFNRKVDPIADKLTLLQKLVIEDECAIGLGFDCDGDRLAVVDSRGRKRSGDFMLTLALSRLLPLSDEKSVVVSVDTTQAIDDVASKIGCKVLRSAVGEANVVNLMQHEGVRLGGEGSSGGLIDGSFNYCRDSMLAALVIIRALNDRGTGIYDEVKSYHQARVALQVKRANALRAIKTLAARHKDADTMDGVKLRLSSQSWVLIRPSGTEDAVRVSAEAETGTKAERIAKEYSTKLLELAR